MQASYNDNSSDQFDLFITEDNNTARSDQTSARNPPGPSSEETKPSSGTKTDSQPTQSLDQGISSLSVNSDEAGTWKGTSEPMATTERSDEGLVAHIKDSSSSSSKPKRVRTGCLTCRERHLKCDEAFPSCLNCRKSSRECRRGVKLNFIDTQCKAPPYIPYSHEWHIHFRDESRAIADEYVDGLRRYAIQPQEDFSQLENAVSMDFSMPAAPAMAHQSLPSVPEGLPDQDQHQPQNSGFFDGSSEQKDDEMQDPQPQFTQPTMPPQQHRAYEPVQERDMSPEIDPSETRELLTSQEETLYMQVFVEEVAIWMDSMDSMKHFSRIMPFHSLKQPMLLNAFLACGVRHLTLVNPAAFSNEKAILYYDAASKHLLRALQNPNRNSVICATTAVILNVYEIMTEKALPRMNHIAGARALIKECCWNARAQGIGAACFWLNVGLETLSNMRFNWQSSWNPDDWGLDLDLTQETMAAREESWTLKMLYIIAKISDFRATIPRMQNVAPMDEQAVRQQRYEEWSRLKHMTDTWNSNCPRTMHPLAYLYPNQTASGSCFPEIWLVKRTTVIARLFYHTAMVFLAQINPARGLDSATSSEMRQQEDSHAHQICGIVAHVKDRGVASVALRSLAHAAECLTVRREQEEVLRIFTRIHKDTGWRIGFVPQDLHEKWGWAPEGSTGTPAPAPSTISHSHQPSIQSNMSSPQFSATQQQQLAAAAAAAGGLSTSSSSPAMNGSMSVAPSMGSPGQRYQFDQYAEYHNWKQQQQQRQQEAQAQVQAQVAAAQQYAAQQHHQQQQQQQQQSGNLPGSSSVAPGNVASQDPQQQQQQQPRRAPPQGIVNPMFAIADFANAKHPYQDHYVAPNIRNQDEMMAEAHSQGLGLEVGGFYGSGLTSGYGWGGDGGGPSMDGPPPHGNG
ncbi:MAG: hypothetical protein M1831_001658 [Alyxoria varia]|nr:MAG: hypothetical protein M1831_001658 [Alyxoria varia]